MRICDITVLIASDTWRTACVHVSVWYIYVTYMCAYMLRLCPSCCLHICIHVSMYLYMYLYDGAEVQSLMERVQQHSSELSEHCEEQVCLVRLGLLFEHLPLIYQTCRPVSCPTTQSDRSRYKKGPRHPLSLTFRCPHPAPGASPGRLEHHRNRQEQAPPGSRGYPRTRQGGIFIYTVLTFCSPVSTTCPNTETP